MTGAEIMTVSEIAEQYGLSVAWVRRLASEGRFPHARKSGAVWLIPREDVDRYLDTRRGPGRPPDD